VGKNAIQTIKHKIYQAEECESESLIFENIHAK
jgi:hypothetical protein